MVVVVVGSASHPMWEEVMREVNRGYRFPSIPELCAVADATGMHPVLTRRFEFRLQQALGINDEPRRKTVGNVEVLRDIVSMDAHLLPFLHPALVVSAVTDPPSEGGSPSLGWHLLARCVAETGRVPDLIEAMADTPAGDELAWAMVARANAAWSRPVLDALEGRGAFRFLAAAAAAVTAQSGTLASVVSREDQRAAADRWRLVGRLLVHAAAADDALTAAREFVAAGADGRAFPCLTPPPP